MTPPPGFDLFLGLWAVDAAVAVAAACVWGLGRAAAGSAPTRRGPALEELLRENPRPGRREGWVEGLRVAMTAERRGQDVICRLAVTLPGLPPETNVVRTPGGRDVHLGDPEFDPKFHVDAEGLGLAWLGSSNRATLLRLADSELTKGQLRVARPAHLFRDEELSVVVRAAKSLLVPDPVAALGEIALRDPSPVLQARAASALLGAGHGTGALLQAWAQRGGAVGVLARLHAAEPDDGFPDLPTDQQLAVVEHLRAHGPLGGLIHVLDALRPDTARVVVSHLADAVRRAGEGDAAVAFARAALRTEDPFVADKAAGVLMEGDTWATAALAALLPHTQRETDAALAWLEARGTPAAVPSLDTLLSGTWPLSQRRARLLEVKSAVQSRVVGGAGGLALASGDAGGLSVAVGRQGGLSETGPPRPDRVPEGGLPR